MVPGLTARLRFRSLPTSEWRTFNGSAALGRAADPSPQEVIQPSPANWEPIPEPVVLALRRLHEVLRGGALAHSCGEHPSMKVLSGDVVARAQRGERLAQRELYDEYADAIFGYVTNQLGARSSGAREEAIDLAQDIWLRAFRRLGSLADPQAFHAWLFQIATNVVRNHAKRAKPPPLVSLDQPAAGEEDGPTIEVPDSSGEPARVAAENELGRRIQQALGKLPAERREVVVLHHLEGFDVKEIAEQLGVAVGTVKSRLGRGRAALRELLADLVE